MCVVWDDLSDQPCGVTQSVQFQPCLRRRPSFCTDVETHKVDTAQCQLCAYRHLYKMTDVDARLMLYTLRHVVGGRMCGSRGVVRRQKMHMMVSFCEAAIAVIKRCNKLMY